MNPAPDFFTSFHCRARVHCDACRSSPTFRDALSKQFAIAQRDFDCPHDVTVRSTGPSPGSSGEHIVKAGQALLRSARQFGRGASVLVGAAERLRRRSICRACAALDNGRNRCRVCGCLVPAKTALATESCPLGKW